MRKTLVLTFCIISAFWGFCHNKINLKGLDIIENYTDQVKSRTNVPEPILEIVVTMNQGWEESIFQGYGISNYEVITANIVVVELPLSSIVDFSQNPMVKYVEFGNEYQPMLDFARPGSNVNEIQEGFSYENTQMSFDGTGVVTGLMDVGIDPNHINFKDAEGNLRVKQVYDYNKSISATTPAAIKRYSTDDASETHGTHVAGIMAGSYNGEGVYCYMSSPSQGSVQNLTGNIPFYGVATNADIVMTAGAFTDANILKGVKAVIDYAESQNMPAVVNLSLGSNDGPHDGTTSLSAGLAELGENHLICVAAGNEGDNKMFVGAKFTENYNTLKTFINSNKSSGIDIWAKDEKPLKVTIYLYETSRRRLTEIASVNEAGQSVSSSAVPVFTNYMSSNFKMQSEVNALNDRFHVAITGSFEQSKPGYYVALYVEGEAGQEVYVYGYGNYSTSFTSNAVGGYTDGTTDGTISGMACGENIIAVGAYTTRIIWGTFKGAYRYSGNSYVVGNVSPFSSYGDNFQGINLPVACAPGANIISSLNRFYTNSLSEDDRLPSTSASVEGDIVSYWGAMQGTSMACPYMAGTMALWLQADPSLKVNDAIEIIKKTAIAPDESLSDLVKKQWGGGRLDALAGIKEVLERKNAGVQGILADVADELILRPVDSRAWEVSVASAASITARLYNMQGIEVASRTVNDSQLTLDASHVAPGLYVLAVETPNTNRLTRRLLVK